MAAFSFSELESGGPDGNWECWRFMDRACIGTYGRSIYRPAPSSGIGEMGKSTNTSWGLMIAKQQPVLCKVLCVASMVVVEGGARLTQAGSWICHACARRQRVLLTQGQRRPIHLSYLKKQAEAAKAWQVQATEIREGRKQGMLEILESRGYVGQIAGLVNGFCFHA
jgi:hypothetical protein